MLHMCYYDEVDDEGSSRIAYLNKHRSVHSFVTRLVWIKETKRNKQTQFSVANKVETMSSFGSCSWCHACHVLLQWSRNAANCTTWCHKMGPATLIKWDPVCWIWSDSRFEIQPENFMWLWKTCFPSTNIDLKMRCTRMKTNCVVSSDLNHGRHVVQKKMIIQINATLK